MLHVLVMTVIKLLKMYKALKIRTFPSINSANVRTLLLSLISSGGSSTIAWECAEFLPRMNSLGDGSDCVI